MRALSVLPGEKDSDRLDEIDEPDRAEGSVLVATVAVGVCGTDHEILSGAYGRGTRRRGAPGAGPRVRRTGPGGAGGQRPQRG
ncbi:MAG: hypothetical protein WKF83_10820 [Nocardioidaceae bacterium]